MTNNTITETQEVVRRQPPFAGIYLAKDDDGKEFQVEVTTIADGKKRITAVVDYGGPGIHIPTIETGLDFHIFMGYRPPLEVDLGRY